MKKELVKQYDLTGNEMLVFKFLKRGKHNRCTRGYLAAKTQLGDRAVRQAVHGMRVKGLPICSITGKPGGYWLCKDDEELKSFVAELEVQRDCFSKAIRNLKKLQKGVQNGTVLF